MASLEPVPVALLKGRSLFRAMLMAGLLALALAGAGCSKNADAQGKASGGEAKSADAKGKGGASKGGGAPAVPVVVGEAVSRLARISVSGIGTVEAVSTVAVKSKVEGELIRVAIREGQEVKAGDVLFEIDKRPFEIALRQAQAEHDRQQSLKKEAAAALARDQATVQNADTELQREKDLLGKGISSKDQYDKQEMAAKTSHAVVAADEAALATADQAIRAAEIAIDNAKLQLSYCTLTAPIDGRLGSLLVHQGNLVKADSDAGLVVINRMRPINVAFTLPEKNLATINARMAKGTLQATAAIPDNSGSLTTGTLTFVDNQIDSQTGTIRLKAVFPNDAETLWPGQFVDVTLALDEIPDATMIPKRAIVTGQNGLFCFVVGSDLTVQSRPIAKGPEIGDMAVVASGLKPGERIVLDGQIRLADGSRIAEMKDLAQAAPAAPKK